MEHLRHLINGQYADRLSLFNFFEKNVRIVMSKGERYFLSLEISVAPFVAVRKELKLIGSLLLSSCIFYDFCVIFKSPMTKHF